MLTTRQVKLNRNNEVAMAKGHVYKKAMQDAKDEVARVKPQVAILKGKNEGLERSLTRVESDLRFHMKEAEKYRNECYKLDVKLNTIETQLGSEVQTLNDRLKLVEGERDALKTSLKEEEVLRIAAEGQIPLPAATTDEHDEYDEFGSPVRSPRKQRTSERDEEDKENVAPKQAVVELNMAQQELAMEKRLRERAQEQIEFMKMECQFRCCSCRIADSTGSDYVHDNSYAAAIEVIKASVPALTPPPSVHGDEQMEDIVKEGPSEVDRPFTPPNEHHSTEVLDQTCDTTVLIQRPTSTTPEPAVLFSPTTGTFRSVPSPAKADIPAIDDSVSNRSHSEPSAITELTMGASFSVSEECRLQSRASIHTHQVEDKTAGIVVHEDVVMDSDEEDGECGEDSDAADTAQVEAMEPPVTPYFTRTITTTTTIPLHFSPMTPAVKSENEPMTPSTIAHAPVNARTPVLGELTLNKLPIDREAALEAIRQRRGRARSYAAGQETPRKQMMEGVKERRDVSAPVSRIRR